MAVKKTKKLSGQATVTTINTDQKFPVTDANGWRGRGGSAKLVPDPVRGIWPQTAR